ncbi:hypothetical protein [uncultured Polaribacter sp.]|uniref:hypothetical protein n=1 Tax=uncultured Polaribacter sp. TaxID=174711 RepID=UPI00260EDCBB|nr:hypothetical protein [uncultured Polaribacter sp.]
MNKLIIEKKTDSIINSFYLKYKNREKIKKNIPLVKSLKKLDTIFILFKQSKNEIKKSSGTITKKLEGSIDYTFNFSDGHYFNFLQAKYMNNGFDSLLSDFKIKDKRFLGKNKERIITYDSLNENIEELENIFFTIQNKVFYIIDCKDTTKGKIKLKQVNLFGNYISKE